MAAPAAPSSSVTLHAAQLLEAVERGDPDGVRRAILEGGNPNARKVLTLTSTVSTGLFKSEKRTDSIQAETALALALRRGDVEVARALLEAGVDPNWPVVWDIPGTYSGTWSQSEWAARWYWRFTFPSALCLAVGRGCTVTAPDGTESRWQKDANKGKLLFNKAGAEVKLTSPSNGSEAFDVVHIDPKPEMIVLLLNHGAPVTPKVMDAFWALGQPRLTRLLERHMMVLVSALGGRVAQLEMRVQDLDKENMKYKRELRVREERARAPSPGEAKEMVPMEEHVEPEQEPVPGPHKFPTFNIPLLTLTEPTLRDPDSPTGEIPDIPTLVLYRRKGAEGQAQITISPAIDGDEPTPPTGPPPIPPSSAAAGGRADSSKSGRSFVIPPRISSAVASGKASVTPVPPPGPEQQPDREAEEAGSKVIGPMRLSSLKAAPGGRAPPPAPTAPAAR